MFVFLILLSLLFHVVNFFLFKCFIFFIFPVTVKLMKSHVVASSHGVYTWLCCCFLSRCCCCCWCCCSVVQTTTLTRVDAPISLSEMSASTPSLPTTLYSYLPPTSVLYKCSSKFKYFLGILLPFVHFYVASDDVNRTNLLLLRMPKNSLVSTFLCVCRSVSYVTA